MSNSGKKSMEIALFCIIPVAFTGLIKGEGVLPHDSLNASVGMSVTFSTTVTPQEAPFSIIDWKFNGTTIIFFNEVINTTPGYEGKVNISMDTASLELRNLTVNDSGQYSVIIVPRQQSAREGATTLNVYVPVSGVVVSNPDGDLVESNSSVRLSCSSSGSSLSFLWLNSSSGVTASDRVHTTDGGSTLVIRNVTRYDQGPFRCRVSNPVSSGTSDPVDLTINYGPENTFVQPTNEYYEAGSNITLNCSTISMPPALVNWFRNEVRLSETGPHLELNNVQENQSGNYSCQAFNNKTLRYDMSQILALNILADSGPACSGGCIAAISVSCVVLVGAAIGGCFYYRTQFHKKPEGKSGATTEREYQDNAAYSGSQELTYSNIVWSQNKDAATPQLELQKETQYAQIRANNCPPLPSEPPTYDVHMQQMQSRKLN
ncbi:carcinoembryonic antigen-related cell adhesion molecule 6-like isoform X2 [Takifugu flavidus]|uniref:carcinoembryonic antigen-related cell adhesion molecule 6-like isoform X2 n=1 Tax=Takifugu flavidus TaxID=433684 RepID=UPI0025442BFE|nr:carcinoembryonic antigen-related cell adhesion molecule 6-like isoform X2 [Takifugu flavidus]